MKYTPLQTAPSRTDLNVKNKRHDEIRISEEKLRMAICRQKKSNYEQQTRCGHKYRLQPETYENGWNFILLFQKIFKSSHPIKKTVEASTSSKREAKQNLATHPELSVRIKNNKNTE